MQRRPMLRSQYHDIRPPNQQRHPLPKYSLIIGCLITMSVIALGATLGTALWNSGHAANAEEGPYLGLTNMGMPSAPQAFYPSTGYDIAVDDRGNINPNGILQQDMPIADHGPNCGAPTSVPTTASSHSVHTIQDSVYICHDHVMTALNMDGYGEAVILPDAAADWSSGPVTIDWNVSTFFASNRDWWDAWVTPPDNQLVAPARAFYPDLNGEPMNSIHVEAAANNGGHSFKAQLFTNGHENDLNTKWWVSQESALTPSRSIRTHYELVISRSHIKFWLPDYNLVYLDQDVSVPFTTGVLQLAHHSYNPQKSDGCGPPDDQTAVGHGCAPNTWHWSNISISNATHFDINHPARRFLFPAQSSDTFSAPVAAGSHLRFMMTGSNQQISWDKGASWQSLAQQSSTKPATDTCTIRQFYVPIPAGATGFSLRAGNDCYGNIWFGREFSVVGPLGSAPSTPPPGSTPSPTPVSIPMNNMPCMITVNGVMVNGTCTGTFSPSK